MAPDIMTIVDRPNASDWSLENGYKESVNQTSYPLREHNAGSNTGFSFILHVLREDIQILCITKNTGFSLYFHSPGDTLFKSFDQSQHILSNEEVGISIKPKLTTTSEGLRHYGPNVRQCYFESERRLRFFKIYSQSNCEHECMANYTLNKCGSVIFSMPSNLEFPFRIHFHSSTKKFFKFIDH